MRFLCMIRLNENTSQVPSDQLERDMGTLLDEMTGEGVLIHTAALRPTSRGVRVRLRAGEVSVLDGPFVETNEVVGGFIILETETLQDAIRQTKRFLRIHRDEWDLDCELRPFVGPEFGVAAKP